MAQPLHPGICDHCGTPSQSLRRFCAPCRRAFRPLAAAYEAASVQRWAAYFQRHPLPQRPKGPRHPQNVPAR